MRSAMLFALFSAACMAQEPARPADTDKAGLQGEWVASRVEALQQVEDPKKIRVTVEGDKLVISGVKDKKESYTFQLDSSKSPKVIDFYEGDKLVSHSIYALEKDEFRFCFGLAHWSVSLDGEVRKFTRAGDRPTAFDSRQGVLVVLRRGKGK